MPPAPLLAKPRIKPGDLPYLEAFQTLSVSREGGFGGEQPIQLSEILAYVNLVGIASRADIAKYLRLVQSMDQEYLRHQREMANRRAAQNKNNSGQA